MSLVRSSLQRLVAAVGSLESAFDSLESSIAGEQRDMFASGASNQNGGLQSSGAQKEAMAQRLDVAIEKVEKMLAQGSGQ